MTLGFQQSAGGLADRSVPALAGVLFGRSVPAPYLGRARRSWWWPWRCCRSHPSRELPMPGSTSNLVTAR